MKAILITGSRDFNDMGAFYVFFGDYDPRETVVIVGGQKTKSEIQIVDPVGHTHWFYGADYQAEFVARLLGFSVVTMPAPWEKRGKAAGPKRNGWMNVVANCLRNCLYAVECHAWPLPGSRGTWNCTKFAKRFGFKVTVHR